MQTACTCKKASDLGRTPAFRNRAVERRGYTIVPLELYWKEGRAKLEIGLAKGKKQHDKRANDKDRDWQRDKGRIMKAMR